MSFVTGYNTLSARACMQRFESTDFIVDHEVFDLQYGIIQGVYFCLYGVMYMQTYMNILRI
jgi:hypothetical protein